MRATIMPTMRPMRMRNIQGNSQAHACAIAATWYFPDRVTLSRVDAVQRMLLRSRTIRYLA